MTGYCYTGQRMEGTGLYDYAGGTRIAMRTGSEAPKYLLGDHLGSTSVRVNADGSGLNGERGVLR
jgi:hypothetical protein